MIPEHSLIAALWLDPSYHYGDNRVLSVHGCLAICYWKLNTGLLRKPSTTKLRSPPFPNLSFWEWYYRISQLVLNSFCDPLRSSVSDPPASASWVSGDEGLHHQDHFVVTSFDTHPTSLLTILKAFLLTSINNCNLKIESLKDLLNCPIEVVHLN